MIRRYVDRLRNVIRDRRGNVAVAFAFALLPLVGGAGMALDYSIMAQQRSRMQFAADTAALRAARELLLAPTGTNYIATLARNYAQSTLSQTFSREANVVVGANVVEANSAVHVTIAATYKPLFPVILKNTANLSVQAVARSAGYPICALALDDSAPGTINLQANARLTAQKCSVYSNSTSGQGLQAVQSAVLSAGMICTAGGKVGSNANFNPIPLTDCPAIPDPLASRALPPVGPCTTLGQVIDGLTVTLSPGAYCDGLRITNGANVTLSPGVYVIKNGPLIVEKGATLRGINAGLFLTGERATIQFESDTTIGLTAPTNGPLAGILLFEDPATSRLHQHKILSDNAPVLLGTIYLPQGRLIIDAHKPIAHQSAYTIIVARRIELFSGPNLVLNTDYGATNIPVPKGVGPGVVRLTQ